MQDGHKLVVFATKKFVIPLLFAPKVNSVQIFHNITLKILFRPNKMALEWDGTVKCNLRGLGWDWIGYELGVSGHKYF